MARGQALLAETKALPQDRISEIDDFVDFIAIREHNRIFNADLARLNAGALTRVRDDSDDGV